MLKHTTLPRCFVQIICAIVLLLTSFNIKAQELNDAEVKTALVYNFLKYINNLHFDTVNTIHLGLYGDDEVLLESLKQLDNKKVQGKEIKIVYLNKGLDINNLEVLFLFNENNFELSRINKLINKDPILLITDRAEDKKLVSINFIHQDNKILFEVNSKNLNENGFYSSPKLLVLGGTELDVRLLYKEAEESLRTEQQRARQIQFELNEKQKEVNLLSNELDKLNANIDSLNFIIINQIEDIKTQRFNLDSISKELESRQAESVLKGKILDSINHSLLLRNKQIRSLDIDLTQKQRVLKETMNSLESLRKEIDVKELELRVQEGKLKIQENKLKEQSNKIESQNLSLLIISAFVMVLIILVLVVYSNLKVKKKQSIELEKHNKKINQQNEQIAFQAEELALKNKELERLSIVAEKTNNAVIIMNSEGIVEWANEGFENQHEYKLYEFIELYGKNFIDVSTNKDAKSIFNQCKQQNKSVTYESAITTKSGTTKWLQTTLTPVLKDNGQVDKFVVIDTDISKLKKAESKILKKNSEINEKAVILSKQATDLKETNIELENQKNRSEKALAKLKDAQSQLVAAEKMASLGQLTAGIAHEINNPITYISSSIEGLLGIIDDIKILMKAYNNSDELENNPQIQQVKKEIDYDDIFTGFDELTGNIKLGVDRTKEIVTSLRNFSRSDDDSYSRTDLNQCINSAVTLLGKSYKERITISKELGELPLAMCMAGKINQVFLNILVNAVQSIEQEGEIKITSELLTQNNIEYAKISICDSGKGMTDETKEKIFEPFFTTKDIGEGTGLGMSITYGIVKKHKGFIKIDSKLELGTIFDIYLPINKA